MKNSKSRMTMTAIGPFYRFEDRAIDLTKKARKSKKSSPKRKGPKKR